MFSCEFHDESKLHYIKEITPEAREEIFNSMYKFTDEERQINCSSCGYPTCESMALAIFNGFNAKENCIYYQREDAIRSEKISYMDKLTGTQNRNAFETHFSNCYELNLPLSVIVADVNGLKQVNDNEGHDEGDKLIKNCAKLLLMMYGESSVYRIGGDEFIAIRQDFNEEDTMLSISYMKKKMDNNNFHMALGYAYTDSFDGDFKSLQKKADLAMYNDKEEYYRTTGKDRRR
ncbi:MAG: diguanylate cyclase [Lachnospiraceae bacterium]|nr:diguanylate cyclase [Lachnospiraceae bacterium]